MSDDSQQWWVYLLRSANRSRTYVGVALDVARRLEQHNGELPGGAKSTRGGRPWSVAREFGPYEDRSRAQQVEAALKRVRGAARMQWTPDDDEEG